jgi:hypothetical protein
MIRTVVASLILLLAPPARAEVLLNAVVGVLVDGGNDYSWEKVALPGTSCGDGSQYKFFVHRTGSSDVLFYFEGGGACWDYDTCSGRAGVLGAANPNGLTDDYMTGFSPRYVSPLVNGADPGLPLRERTPLVTAGWNVVYMPYCTGDVHIGNRDTVYVDPTGAEPPLSWRHHGFANVTAAAGWVAQQFPAVDRLLVSGYSAGGTAAVAAYWFVRGAIAPRHGFLLDDSGPAHLAPNAAFPSRALHEQIRESWALDPVLDLLPPSFDRNDFGSINAMLATEFPADRLAYTGFLRDYNYSRFSYERFITPNDKESVLALWAGDQQRLFTELGRFPNVSVFVGYERQMNASHCSTIITFLGSHACADVEKKRNWWEYLELPVEETWKCYSEMVPMSGFLDRFMEGERIRIVEPPNGYNAQDPGMKIVGPLIDAAIGP